MESLEIRLGHLIFAEFRQIQSRTLLTHTEALSRPPCYLAGPYSGHSVVRRPIESLWLSRQLPETSEKLEDHPGESFGEAFPNRIFFKCQSRTFPIFQSYPCVNGRMRSSKDLHAVTLQRSGPFTIAAPTASTREAIPRKEFVPFRKWNLSSLGMYL
jgi:hypothetical protein